jgi:hypothetical protein
VARDKILFDNLTPLYPDERIRLEMENGPNDYSSRVMDFSHPSATERRLDRCRARQKDDARKCRPAYHSSQRGYTIPPLNERLK